MTDPNTLTFLKEGYDKIEFSFPDLNGKQVSLKDDRFKNKAVIIQIQLIKVFTYFNILHFFESSTPQIFRSFQF